MKRRGFVAAAVAAILMLGGCAMQPESKLEEYRPEAERIAAEAVALVPEASVQRIEDPESAGRLGVTESAEQRPDDPAWWQVRSFALLQDVPDASATAAAAVTDKLTRTGWDVERVREVDSLITDGFRATISGESWYLELVWHHSEEGLAETIEILVVSPMTTRGEWRGF